MLQWYNHVLGGTTKDSVRIGEAFLDPISSELCPTSEIGSLGTLIGIGAGKGTSNPTHQNQEQHFTHDENSLNCATNGPIGFPHQCPY
jgi:hypothetical protein